MSTTLKYKLEPEGRFYRLIALRDFGDVKAGDKGGLVSGEHNLSHDGLCWISDGAQVYDTAQVYGNAQVCGSAWVYDDTQVSGGVWT